MGRERLNGRLRIGELAARIGTSPDTVRYYERLGLLVPPRRSEGGYRLYGKEDLGRLQFIRRAKRLGLSLEEIRSLLGLAQKGECRPLRRQVAELLRAKLDECEAKLAELAAFKADLGERYRLTLERQDEPSCSCATFPASCTCLPVQVEELAPFGAHGGRVRRAARQQSGTPQEVTTMETIKQQVTETGDSVRVLNSACNCGCGSAPQPCSCGCDCCAPGRTQSELSGEQLCQCGEGPHVR